MSYRVVVADRMSAAGIELLEQQPGIDVVSVAAPAELPAALGEAHALIVRSETQVTDELLANAPHLVVVARAGIGVDNIDVDAATRRGIAVLNAPGANTVSAAEHAVALLLALQRRIPGAVHSMREGGWDRKAFAGSELRGKTIGIVGLGRIGQHVAGLARAFGMTVIAHDPFLPEERARELNISLSPLHELLAASDVVTLHLPLTEETQDLIDRERIARMKRGAVLINTARGGLVNEQALIDALESGAIGGAALDVFEPEPLPAESPLRRTKGLILTPHLAASTTEAQDRVAREIGAAVRDALLTGSFANAVNAPGLSREALTRLRVVLDLARRLGRLASSIAHGPVRAVKVGYGGDDDEAPRPTLLAALEGILAAMGVGPVTIVNAAVLAEDRGIAVSRRVGAPAAGFETTVGVTVETEQRTVSVLGAVVGDRVGRVIQIDEFPVDVPAEGHMVVLRNRDVPGVIGRVGTLLGEAHINIASYHQSRLERGGGDALAAISVDEPPSSEVLVRLGELPDILEVRFANLDGR
jgi:D-3-phosphoglycerate dehydrogenase